MGKIIVKTSSVFFFFIYCENPPWLKILSNTTIKTIIISSNFSVFDFIYKRKYAANVQQ